jgi:DNA recombination protein RmuC
MTTLYLLIFLIVLVSVAVVMVAALLRRNGYKEIEGPLSVALAQSQDKTERAVREELAKNRAELAHHLQTLSESLLSGTAKVAELQAHHLSTLTQSNEKRLDNMRETIEKSLTRLQADNTKKLEEMRATVDEKLHKTLERRLGESFNAVSEQLERVQKGLGEMQSLALI